MTAHDLDALTEGARALTIRQPWASLIALGVKTIETRSWSTAYRGPLLIHAGKAWPVPVAEWQVPAARSNTVGAPCVERLVNPADPVSRRWEMLHTPLGAVVAVVDLVDVVPIVDGPEHLGLDHVSTVDAAVATAEAAGARFALVDTNRRLMHVVGNSAAEFTDQVPYGDFTPGRYAWLLDKVRPVDPPIEAKGRQGLWRWQP